MTAKPGDVFVSAIGERWFLAADPDRDPQPWVQVTGHDYTWRKQAKAEAAGLTPLVSAADVVEHGTPAGLHWAADEVEQYAGRDTASRSAVDLRREADRRERKAEEAARDKKDRELAEKIAREHLTHGVLTATVPLIRDSIFGAVLAGIRAGREEADHG
jgi:hypothetical protein